MNNSTSMRAMPELPAMAKIPLEWAPMVLKTSTITFALNALFAAPLQEGELEFLNGRDVNVIITDARLRFSLTLDNAKLRADSPSAVADVAIEGTVYTFLLLATREEDADTLFFRRQLKTSGDTELGLHVKNFFDGLDPSDLPYHQIINPLLRKSLTLADAMENIRNRLTSMKPNFI